MNVQGNINNLLAIGAGLKALQNEQAVNPKVREQQDKASIAKSKASIAESKLKTLKARQQYKELKNNPSTYNQKAQDQINTDYQQAKDFESRQNLIKNKVMDEQGNIYTQNIGKVTPNHPLYKQLSEKLIKGDK